MARSCPQCNAPFAEPQRFCRQCGYRLDTGLQDYTETRPYVNKTTRAPRSTNPISESPSLYPAVPGPTSPLEQQPKRRKIIFALTALTLGCAMILAAISFDRQPQPVDESSAPTVDDIVQMKVHGIDGAFIKEMEAAGLRDLSADELVQLKIHGIDADFVRQMAKAGMTDLSLDNLVQLKIQGIDAGFVEGILAQGFDEASVDDLVQLKIHGIDSDYVKSMREAMVADLTIDDLVQLKIHGVDASFIRALESRGVSEPTVDGVIQTKIHGAETALPHQ